MLKLFPSLSMTACMQIKLRFIALRSNSDKENKNFWNANKASELYKLHLHSTQQTPYFPS